MKYYIMKYTLLTQIIPRFANGTAHFQAARRSRWLKFVLDRRTDDGMFFSHNESSGFSSTLFGLRILRLLGALGEKDARKTADSLRNCLVALQKGDKRFVSEKKNPTGLVGTDLYAVAFASELIKTATDRDVFAEADLDRRQFVLDGFGALKRANGGVSSSVIVRHTSTYNTFLAVAALQMAGIPLEQYDSDYYSLLSKFIRNRQQPGGGFVELELIPTIGTVATASAINIAEIIRLERLNELELASPQAVSDRMAGDDDAYNRSSAHSFLLRMHAAHGGYRAINRIPDATMWSTYTAIVGIGVLTDWKADYDHREATLSFLESLYRADGYVSAAWDTQPALDSTYYALAIQSILS